MHFFVVEDGEARPNFIWLPYLLAHNQIIQTAINHAVSTEFLRHHGRSLTDSEDDLDRLDEIALDVFDRYVPAFGFREYVRGVKSVRILDYKQKECKDRLIADYHIAKSWEREHGDESDKKNPESDGGACRSTRSVDDCSD